MGVSGSGVVSELRRVIQKANVWKKHGLDVREIYFNSGALMARAMLAGDIGATHGDIPPPSPFTYLSLIAMPRLSTTAICGGSCRRPGVRSLRLRKAALALDDPSMIVA